MSDGATMGDKSTAKSSSARKDMKRTEPPARAKESSAVQREKPAVKKPMMAANKPTKPTHRLMSKRPSKAVEPALVFEEHKLPVRQSQSSTIGNEKIVTSATAPPANEARRPANDGAESDKPIQQRDSIGTVLLAQAAMQTSSLTLPEAPLTLPLVTPPTLPQQNPRPPSPSERRRGIPHTYTDYASVPDSTTFVRKKTGGVTKPFPEKLHELLSTEAQEDIVSWLPHGRAFLVRKPKAFTSEIMGKYFKQTKLTSFQRQLNLCKLL